MEKAIRMNDTMVIRKQKTMLLTVSSRALPDGKWFRSTRFTARFDTINVTLDIGSKMASAIVVNRESDPEEIAPQSWRPASATLAAKEPHTAIWNLR